MPTLAPLIAAWKNRARNLPGPLAGSGEASNGNPVQVEMLVAGAWVDITSDAMVRDDGGQISISSGIRDEGSQTEQGTAQLQLKNRDGRYSPRNPAGPYYGLIGRNTPMRISVPDGLGGKSYRLWGEVAEWAPNWDTSGSDVWVDVTVSGILRRLAQGPAPQRSVIYNAITNPLPSSVVAYWPMEDATGSTSLASTLTTGSPMTWTGVPALASYDGFTASDPLPDLTSGTLSGSVAKYSDPTATQVRFLVYFPKSGLADGKTICAFDQVDYSAGSAQFWELYYSTTDATNSVVLRTCASDGTVLGAVLPHNVDVRGRLFYASVELQESGTSITRQIQLKDVNTGTVYAVSDTETLTQLTRVTRVQFGVAARAVSGPTATANLPGTTVGHCTVENAITAIDTLGVRLNPIGEPAGSRIQRLCGEQAIAFDWIGDLTDTVPLGAQGKQNLLALAQESTLADAGLLYETSDVLGLGYRTRASLYNQDPTLVLNYTAFNLAEIPVPVEDDRYLQNTLTVTVGGVSATYTQSDGTLGTQAVGTYGESSGLSLNLASAGTPTLLDHAAWRVHLGTVDEARFPAISVNLAHTSITPDMRRAILGLRLGDRLQITNPPSWLPPDTIDQLVLGMSQTITHFEHRLTFVCAPSSPYNNVAVADRPDSRIDIDGSQLLSDITAGATTLVVTPSPGQSMLWSTSAADLPYDVRAGGEIMRVTGVTPWISDTFARTVSSGWGTADTGQVWQAAGGVATDFSVAAGVGTQLLSTVNDARRTFVNLTTILDWDMYCDVAVSATTTGGSIWAGPVGRYTDSNNLYWAALEFATTGALVLGLRKRVNGVEFLLATYAVPGTYTAGTFYRVRFQVMGAVLKAKVWAATDPVETPEWQVTAVDSTFSTSVFHGTRSISSPSNTNVNPQVQYANYRMISPQTMTVTRSMNGVTKAQTAGTDIRLAYPTYIAL